MFINRIMGVFKLNIDTFEEIEADQGATGQAALVVLIVALVAALGSGIGATFANTSFFSSFLSSLIGAFVGWFAWSFVTYFVGTTFFGGKSDLGQMLRVIGFAYAPQVLAIIPCIGWIIGIIWSLIAGFIAIRQGLDLDNTKAFFTIIVGFIAFVIVMAIVGVIFGVTAAGFGALTGAFS
jgi:hypothetical protein